MQVSNGNDEGYPEVYLVEVMFSDVLIEISIVAISTVLVIRQNSPSYLSLGFVFIGCLLDFIVTVSEVYEYNEQTDEWTLFELVQQAYLGPYVKFAAIPL